MVVPPRCGVRVGYRQVYAPVVPKGRSGAFFCFETARFGGQTNGMAHYCDLAPGHPVHGPYHDEEYGFPLAKDEELLERLALEINQAGLSWLTILKKKDNFHRAFEGFDVRTVAHYGEKDRTRLLSDAGIIRNRLKVDAVIHNAGVLLQLREKYGSFLNWLNAHHPLSREDWVQLFKKTFRFTGGEITGEFLMSTGYLPGAHRPECPIFKKIARLNPAWMRSTI